MGNQHNIVVINGKHYDALTGKLLDTAVSAHKKTPKPTTGAAMDGMVRARPPQAPSNAATQPAKKVHGTQEKSKTLMRSAVKKPTAHKLHGKASPASAAAKPLTPQRTPKPLALDAARIARTAHIQKSPLISKFGNRTTTPRPLETKTAVLPVKPAPARTQTHKKTEPAKQPAHHNMFEKALERAVSHQELAPKKLKPHHRAAHKLKISPRAFSLSSFALSAILLGGFLTYQNVPNLAMQVAAQRSGIRAELPAYKPAGFKVSGPIQYSTGQITIRYKARADDRTFAVTQQKSAWNSETLLNNFINSNRHQYQTYQDKGRTIYIYDGGNATWVDSGIWYQIEGKSALSSDQLLRIANSL